MATITVTIPDALAAQLAGLGGTAQAHVQAAVDRECSRWKAEIDATRAAALREKYDALDTAKRAEVDAVLSAVKPLVIK